MSDKHPMTNTSDSPNFRALCAELVVTWDAKSDLGFSDFRDKLSDIVARARSAGPWFGRNVAPPPEPPVDGEVAELVALIRQCALAWDPDARLLGNMTAAQLVRAAELLERTATPPPEPLRPIPVSERLPEAGEWVWHCYTGVRFWEHGRYYSRQKSQPARHWFFIGDGPESQPATHWLPANAIPFPEVTQ